jgi:lipoprotein NlpI
MKDKKAMTDAERTRKHRERKKQEGWRLVQVYLEPRSNAIVEATIERYGMTTAQAVNHLLQETV